MDPHTLFQNRRSRVQMRIRSLQQHRADPPRLRVAEAADGEGR